MKKTLFIIAGAVLLVTSLSVAEEMKGGKMMDKGSTMGGGMMGMMGDDMMGDGMKDKGMMKMGHMMMRSMMDKSIVASNDGGVILLTGNKLIKYDKNLNIVKEAEIPVDAEGMKGMMEQMKQMCPMMGSMMGDGPAPSDSTSQAVTDEEHKSHHK